MIRCHRFSAFLLVALVATVLPLQAAWEQDIKTSDSSGIHAQIDSLYETAPSDGFFPARITIENRSGAARSWTLLSSSSGGNYRNRLTLTSDQLLKVPSGQTGVFDVLLPVSPAQDTSYGQMQVQLIGYGVTRPFYVPSGSSSNSTVFVGMSKKISARSWKPLKDFLEKKRTPLTGTEVDLDRLGEDWRSLLGLRCLWISDGEYSSLSPARRLVIRDWLLQGGELYLCAQNPSSISRSDFGMTGHAESEFAGLGRVHFLEWDGIEFPAKAAADIILALGEADRQGRASSYDANWELARQLGAIVWNIPMLSVGIAVFALIVGPLNLFWFARNDRRHRLFWTTPLISIVASVLLGGLIILQEGFGGIGARAMFVYVDPAAKRCVMLQEQVSKTGVLASSRFDAPAIDFLVPLPISGFGQQDRNTTCRRMGSKYFGDWFSTRWRQGQFAETIRPTRAELRLLGSINGEGTAPQILSSFPGMLSEIFVVDVEGRWWMARDVPAGRRVDLQSVAASRFAERFRQFPAGFRLNDALSRVRERRNFFYAFADSGEFLPTLSSIRWRGDQVLHAGPLAGVASTVTP